MSRGIFSRFYRRLPGFRELTQIRESVRRIEAEVTALRMTEVIRLLDLELGQQARYQDPLRLPRHWAQVNSQNGEDGMIREIFRRIGTTNRVFAEVGVGDGTENNTLFLHSQGWTGFWIDGSSEFRRQLGQLNKVKDLKRLFSFVRKENVQGLFEQLGVPETFDLLSLDIDQNTFHVWEALSRFHPRVVVVEYNASIPSDLDWKVSYDGNRVWDGTVNFGASLKAFEVLGRQLHYSLVGCDFTGANAFFVREDLVGDLFAGPFTSENHYEPPRYALRNRRGHATAALDR